MTRIGSATSTSQRAAFAETVRLARSTPFYQEHWSDVVGLPDLDEIEALPTIDKGHLARHGRRMLTEQTFPDQVLITGGSTYRPGDPVSFREFSRAEYAAFDRLAESIPSSERRVPIALELVSDLHGASAGFRRATFRLPLSRINHFAAIDQLLVAQHEYVDTTDRVKVLVGSVESLRVLAALRAERAPTSDWAVVACLATAAHLGQRDRAELGASLGGEVLSVYGLTEVGGSTSIECSFCRYFHLPPTVYGELLDVNGRNEIAELCLTSLAPFQVRQPLVRYRTGDLVTVAPPDLCEVSQTRGFRLIGRRATSHWISHGREVLLPDNLLAEQLAVDTRLRTRPYPSTAFLDLSSPPSVPGLRITQCGDVLRLEVESLEITEDARELVRRTVDALVEKFNELSHTEVDVHLRPPGAISLF